jgi:3-phenylpropionate/trans-cinnamate dioxygenase ferredoxin reductase subunit
VAQQDAQPGGPDLSEGVSASSVLENRPLLGHAGGEPILLTRSNGRIAAVGARCPHYGAPLADGIVVDGAIRCPWHHSAFSLATGECLRPPALGDLPSWDVEQRDGLVVVGARRETPARSPAAIARHPASVVIVGGGAAGLVAADTLRRQGYGGPVTIVSAEQAAPVDRPNLSKDYLAGTAPEEWMPLRPDAWYGEHDIALRLGRRAVGLDPAARRLLLEDGESLAYEALLLATGAEPVRLPLGNDAPVHYLRTLADSRAIIRAAESARTAVVLGASFIGMEVAAALRTRGLDVTVVSPESQPLERALGAALGAFVRGLHQERGVDFRLGRRAESADRWGVQLDDGTRLAADLVVAGVGVRPDTTLAESAGLSVDRGVLVNEHLETSAMGVFAAGDVARWPDHRSGRPIRVEHWVVAQRQGQVAARNMLGANERFEAIPFFWSAHYDVTISYVGHAESPDHVEVDGDLRHRDCTVRYYENGRVTAVATVGRDRASLAAEAEMERLRL